MSSPLEILCLENDAADAELAQETLQLDGIACNFTRVETESDFVAALQQGGFDVILADYTLPSFDGLSALRIARKQRPDLPFIFVSGTLGEEVAVEALKIGATDYILKSRLSRLVPSVERALREARERAERRRSDEALRRSEASLAIAQRLSHTGSFGWDLDSGEISWSLEMFRIFELDPQAKPTIEFILQRAHPDDRARVKEVIDRTSIDRSDFHIENRLLMPDGRVKYLRVTCGRVHDSFTDTDFVGAVIDITAAKEAERELQERDAKIRRMVDANIIGVVISKLDGPIIEANDAFLEIVGYSREELTSGRLRWTELTPPEWQFANERALAQVRATGTCDVFEKEYVRKDGSHVPVLVAGAAIDEARSEAVTLVLNLTERKEAEREVQRLNEQLEQRIRERTAQLAEANRQLAERNEELVRASRLKSEFLARISHELRTPLNSISGFSDLLAEQNEGPLGEIYGHYVQHVKQGTDHLIALVNEILDLSRIEAGRIELRYEQFPAGDAISEVLSVAGALAEANRIDLRSEVHPALRIYADRTRFKQILYNLVSNAVKFTPPDGKVRITAEGDEGEVRFVVSDTGIGIPEEEHRTIFEEFYQVRAGTTGEQNGAGLGLAITKRLVELQGGRIWVESAPGEGSRFFFTMLAGRTGDEGSAVGRPFGKEDGCAAV